MRRIHRRVRGADGRRRSSAAPGHPRGPERHQPRLLEPAGPDYWLRTWVARGLPHAWPPGPEEASASGAVIALLDDEHWRPVEMALKVVRRHEVGGCADKAAVAFGHHRARVRASAARALGVGGDTEHVTAVDRVSGDPDPGVRRAAELAGRTMRARLDLSG